MKLMIIIFITMKTNKKFQNYNIINSMRKIIKNI